MAKRISPQDLDRLSDPDPRQPTAQQGFIMYAALRLLHDVLDDDSKIDISYEDDRDIRDLIALYAAIDLGDDPSDEAIDIYVKGMRRTVKEMCAQFFNMVGG